LNEKKRSKLRTAIKYADMIIEIADQVAEQENDAMDNMPENLQYSERYERMENAVNCLESVSDAMGQVKDLLEGVKCDLRDAITG